MQITKMKVLTVKIVKIFDIWLAFAQKMLLNVVENGSQQVPGQHVLLV